MPVARSTLRDHLALRGVQRRKQRGGSVPSVIVGYTLDVAKSHRQHRLGAFERLNLALFIYAQNHCIFWWMQVQTYNIPYFFDKKWIAGKLEMLLPVRFQSEYLPDAMYCGFRYPRVFCDLPNTPMRAILRFALQGLAHQSRNPLIADRAWPSRTQFVMQPTDPLRHKSSPPLTNGGLGQAEPRGDRQIAFSPCTHQDDPRSHHQSCRERSGSRHSLQLFFLLSGQNQFGFGSSHGHRHLHCASEMPIGTAILMPLINGT